MALEDILDAIRSEADQEASRIVADASARADAIVRQARAAAADRENELAHAVDERIRRERRRTVSLGLLEASRTRRAAREEIFERVIDRVSDTLKGLREQPRYDDVLRMLLDEALSVLPTPTAAQADPRDVERVAGILAERDLHIPVEPVEGTWGGIGVVTDGRMVRNDLRTRLERAEHHLRYVAGELLPSLRGGGP